MSLRIPTENLAFPVVPFVRMVKGRGANSDPAPKGEAMPHLSTSYHTTTRSTHCQDIAA